MIYFNYPKQIYLKYKSEINRKISDVLKSGNYINSDELLRFENSFSKYLKIKHCIGVGNATDAIYLSLKALNIKSGDEIITVSHTATGTVLGIANTGAKPVFVDINIDTYNMDTNLIEKKISKKTKAILVVHLYGQSCSMEQLLLIAKKKGIPVIEDCSQSAGGKYKNQLLGSFGTFGCFSFFPTKNLSCFGDGGLVSCNDNYLSSKIRSMREYGWDKNRNARYIGINSRLDEIQAAVLNVKLKYLDKDNAERRKIARIYNKEIFNPNIMKPKESIDNYHVYHLYVIRTKNRDKLLNYLKNNNVLSSIHYKLPVHKQKVYFNSKNSNLKITEKISKELISLPIYPGLSLQNQKKVLKLINTFS